ncbi:MAG: 23S rRNA (uracil(1939)-C(5))-methyltransferase RlmD [Bacteroidia bacterium]|nr:23S rRNA (uracil(1939)-C(5))-methyltransferase RlmD [Bacteroidia bacterium]
MSNKKKFRSFLIESVEIETAAAEGKAIARHDGKVIFVPFAAPGDIADITVMRQKKNYAEGQISKLIKASDDRIEPKCSHFGKCGGCKWQHLDYKAQLKLKETQVKDDLQRIAKVEVDEFLPILGCESAYNYRNKLEFTFSNKAWEEHFDKANPKRLPALGFHIPGMFDKVLDLESCFLAPDDANIIREKVKSEALNLGLTFYDIREQHGFLRNLMIRCNSLGEWMLVLIVGQNEPEQIKTLFDILIPQLPMVKEWCYVINEKKNDTWSDLEVHTYKGVGYLTEKLEDLQFKIRPQSFFQTNVKQALELYKITREFAQLNGTENVYDLYTGTGSIAQFIAAKAKFVTGVEYVESAIKDALENAQLNNIHNTAFYAGDMKLVLNDELVQKHGKPDVIITDPPRDGMHQDVINKIIELLPQKIVYVSCNPATQARDIALLSENYIVSKIRAVDMFPNTHHVESVALLTLKS